MSLSSLCICQFALVDGGWFDASPRINPRNWLYRLLLAELFIAAMRKYRPWRCGDPLALFPGCRQQRLGPPRSEPSLWIL